MIVDPERRRKFKILDTYCRIRDNDCSKCVFNTREGKSWCEFDRRYSIPNSVLDSALRMISAINDEVKKND